MTIELFLPEEEIGQYFCSKSREVKATLIENFDHLLVMMFISFQKGILWQFIIVVQWFKILVANLLIMVRIIKA